MKFASYKSSIKHNEIKNTACSTKFIKTNTLMIILPRDFSDLTRAVKGDLERVLLEHSSVMSCTKDFLVELLTLSEAGVAGCCFNTLLVGFFADTVAIFL